MILFFLLSLVRSGEISPYLRKPIEPSVNNELEISDYVFTYTTATDMFKGDQLLIKFPTQYTSLAIIDYQITLQKWNPDLLIWQTMTGGSCTYIPSGPNNPSLFKITLPDVKAGNYKLTIPSIPNPAYGGTGNFKMETRRNDVYKKDVNLIDFNYAFGKVGIAKAATDLSGISTTYLASGVNLINKVTFTFQTNILIPKDGRLTLDLSKSILSISDDQYSSTTTLKGNITRQGMMFQINGFEDNQAAASYEIAISGIVNPKYSGIPGEFTLRTWTNNTNTILNQKKAVNLPSITPGTLTDVTVSAHCTLTGQTEIISVNDITIYQITFSLINAVESTGQIIINWLSGGLFESCYVTNGLYDQSENAQVKCTQNANQFLIQNFKRVQPKTQIVVQFKATNPASAPLSNLEIKTYQDLAQLQLVDTYASATGLTLQSFPQFGTFDITFPTPDHQRAAQTATWVVNWKNAIVPATSYQLKLIFSTSFSFSGLSCTAVNDAAVTDTGTCSSSGSTLTFTFGNTAFSSTNNNQLTIVGVKHPTTPGEYVVAVNLISNLNVVVSRRTVYFQVLPYKLTSIQSFRLSQDQLIKTLIYFKFPALNDIPSSEWQQDFNIMTSEIWVEFQTVDSFHPAPANYQFLTDLGTGLTDQANFPCYGYSKLQPLSGNSEIKCTLNKPSATPDPARVKVHHFRAVLKNEQFELHLPNIQNPECESYLVTVDDLCRSTASVTIKILLKKNRRQYIMYQNDPTDVNLIFPAVLPKIVVKNKYNDNLVGGLPSQASPKFVPTTINQQSSIQIRYEPGSTKPLKSAVDTSQGIIFIFPQLPITDPQAYIVNKNVQCSLGLLTQLNCYAYREVGWVVVIPTALMDIPGASALDVTFYLKNFINPYYAADPIGYIQIITIKDNQQWERMIFQDLSNFSPGSAKSVQVTSRRYEANMIDVEYNWLFSFNNDIPAGGKIYLIYAVNFYDHGGVGRTIDFEVKQGLEPATDEFLSSKNTNIYIIEKFKPYTKGTVISIKMTGVKNPPKAGLTNLFGVSSLTSDNYYIDSTTDVAAMTIIQQVPIGEIVFNHFRMYPDNGSPPDSIFPATYEISFYPTRNIPKNGDIFITFPQDFQASSQWATLPSDPLESLSHSFLDTITDDSDIRCYVSGSLKTMKDCSIENLTVRITLDTELRIEAGMEPVIVTILNVRNFNEDKNSGVIVVQTIYDAVVLDDSGTTETNRKATSGLKATFMTNTQYSLLYYPLTEGVQATYELTLKPTLDIQVTATIVVEFPAMFPYGLGGSVGCDIPLLSKATNDPIQCSVSAWQITLSNLKAYAPTADGFVVIITGVRNPNQIVTSSTKQLKQGIRVYIMSNATHAQEFVSNMGVLSFTPAASILQLQQLYITSSNTRDYADYTLELQPEINGSPTKFKLDFQKGYQIASLWSEKKLTLDGNPFDVEPSGNSFSFDTTFTADITKTFSIVVQKLPNPLDEGICPGYPDLSLYDGTTKQIIMQTYSNLMQPSTPDFKHAGKLIIIDDDDPNHYIEAGTYTNNITLSLYPVEAASQTMEISPLFDEAFKDILTITPMLIDAGQKTGQFRIGVDTSIAVLRVVIKFTHEISDYIPVRPIYLWIQRYKNISISVSDVFQVPAGGRSSVQTVEMSYGSYKPIIFSFYLLNNQPKYSAVYPKTITLSDGQKTGQFWVSCGMNTEGANGQLLTIISGDDKPTFQVANRVRNFSVINPDLNIPFIVIKQIMLAADSLVQVRIVTNEPCTIYFAVVPTFIREITLQQIKNKILPYDYFNYPFIFGEYVYDSPTYEYQILVDSLQVSTAYQFVAFVEDYSGNLADAPAILQFNTTNYTDPHLDSLSLTSSPTVIADTNTSLTLSGLSGKIHAIALKNPSYIYQNHFAADSSVLRSRRILQDSTTTDTTSTDTTTNTTDTTTTDTNTTDTTNSTNTNDTTTDTDNNSNSTGIGVIKSDPYVPDASDYTCKVLSINYLTQICEPVADRKANFTRIDYYAQQLIIPPTGKQISRGENHEGILVEHYTTSSDGTIKFANLVPDSDYFIFIIQESNSQFSSKPLMVKGTTRTLFELYILKLLVPVLIYILI
ncbi:unnamed protein product [Paramecium octaurelia]|uniref:Uncharacterized protein n=1 Tax=Paramecium octaurelia TaxID=43137 RepID=A0A8S1TCC6_PAROT|nr:unnamed protein product [Paramecium octaurelia]